MRSKYGTLDLCQIWQRFMVSNLWATKEVQAAHRHNGKHGQDQSNEDLMSSQDAPPIDRCGLEARQLRTLDKIESIIEAKLELIRELINKSRRDVTQMKAKAYNQGQIYNLLFLGAWVIEIVGDWVTNNRTFDDFNGQEDMVLSNYGMTFSLGVADQASAIFGGLSNPADTRNCFFVEDFMTIANAFQGLKLRTCEKSFDDRASDFEIILKAKMSCILDSLEDSSAELRWILDEFLTGVSLRNQILDES
ncbi:hypothetical protein TCAL_07075 [Tigriopus californicus]|uniref:Uncharacterized protein n=1 Tax=Tigriopus californicus TaxID=6832 RepID=A0A553PNV7_TIGCA|nr:hypothetical protein TCAL_07075 [Tigriopus californicus]